MQYSNVAGKQKSNDVYRYPAELTSGKVRRLKFETVTTDADTDITIGFLPSGTTSILGISRMLASIAIPMVRATPASPGKVRVALNPGDTITAKISRRFRDRAMLATTPDHL